MRILHLSTGIVIASANAKLHYALRACGVESNILCLQKMAEIPFVYQVKNNAASLIENAIARRIEGVVYKVFYPDKENVIYSSGLYGVNSLNFQLIEQADIIHLHWINGGFLSLGMINKIIETGKPIVWTMHDSWPFTGGCHVRYGCERYRDKCGKCPMLHSNNERDISRHIYMLKKKYISNKNISFIAPSKWMLYNLRTSGLFSENECYHIPNTLNTEVFKPRNINEVNQFLNYKKEEKKCHILFGAVSSTTTPYKGFDYLLESLTILSAKDTNIRKKIVIHIFGAKESNADILKKYECKFWGYISEQDKMAYIYNLADIYVFPSIDDNLPNTVMESLSCATPVVAFETGGVPDMVKHLKNGYIARYKDPEDLANGIIEVWEKNTNNSMGINGRKKVLQEYAPDIIAQKHVEVYNKILNQREKK